MFNSHIHLDFTEVARPPATQPCIVPSIGVQNWHKVATLCRAQTRYYPAYGIHPWWAEAHQTADFIELEKIIQAQNPVAIGECGLDFARPISQNVQLNCFQTQLKLAQKYHLPVIIHAVKATEAVILLLKKYPQINGVIHAFSGSQAQADTLIKMGFKLGFGWQITRQNAIRVRALVQKLPLESILLETDDHPNPNDLTQIAQTVADLKQTSIKKVVAQCDNNTLSLFHLT